MRQLVRHGAFLSISASRTLEHPHTSYLIPSKRFYAPPTFVDYRASSAPVHSTYLHVICRCDETPNMECSNEHVHQSTICCIRITGLDTVGSRLSGQWVESLSTAQWPYEADHRDVDGYLCVFDCIYFAWSSHQWLELYSCCLCTSMTEEVHLSETSMEHSQIALWIVGLETMGEAT